MEFFINIHYFHYLLIHVYFTKHINMNIVACLFNKPAPHQLFLGLCRRTLRKINTTQGRKKGWGWVTLNLNVLATLFSFFVFIFIYILHLQMLIWQAKARKLISIISTVQARHECDRVVKGSCSPSRWLLDWYQNFWQKSFWRRVMSQRGALTDESKIARSDHWTSLEYTTKSHQQSYPATPISGTITQILFAHIFRQI